VLSVGRAVQAVFSPIKVNYFLLGNTVPHLHTHVIPRYRDDPWPGGPLDWNDIFAAQIADEATLKGHRDQLRPLL
jgi:diadenosine tetraphosphate (Ap4A) HIT family hydrolase